MAPVSRRVSLRKDRTRYSFARKPLGLSRVPSVLGPSGNPVAPDTRTLAFTPLFSFSVSLITSTPQSTCSSSPVGLARSALLGPGTYNRGSILSLPG